MPDKRKKILVIVPSGFCFGLQHITVRYFSGMKDNIESHFLITHWGNGEFQRLLEKHQLSFSFSWLGMFSRKLDWKNIKMSLNALIRIPFLYYDFVKLKQRFKPDLIYFANHHELILLTPLLYFYRTPVVCHMHDPCPDIQFQKLNFRFYSKRVNSFIAISRSVKERLVKLGCCEDKITLIYNGVDVLNRGVFKRNERFSELAGWPLGVFIFGYSGQITETKGLMDIFLSFIIISKKYPSARLVIGGKKEGDFYFYLKNEINSLGFSDKVFFSGWLTDVDEFYQGIDTFVLASRHDEGFGLVVADAMSKGIPVISSQSGGAAEIVENLNSGLLFPKHDHKALASCMELIMVDEDLRKKMIQNALERIGSDFDICKQTRKLAEFLININ